MEGDDGAVSDWKTAIAANDRVVVDQLKERMKEAGLAFGNQALNTDIHLARFVRARKHQLDDAWEMLKANLAFREEHGVDGIAAWADTDTGKELLAMWPNQAFGRAAGDKPLILEQLSLLDPEELFERFTSKDLIRLHLYVMERELQRCYDISEELGRPVTEIVAVQNCAGLGMHHVHNEAIELVKELLALDEKNYPECMGALIVINAPMVFPLLYRLVKPFIDPLTVEKIQVHSATGWQKSPDFLRVLTPEQIPPQWGGESEQQWERSGAVARKEDEVTEFCVPAGGKHTVTADAEVDGSTLMYSFTTEGHDVAFGVESTAAAGKKKTKWLVPCDRVPSHEEAVSGMKSGLKQGTYLLVFDNSYSWATSKNVSLQWSMQRPKSKAAKRKERKERRQQRGRGGK